MTRETDDDEATYREGREFATDHDYEHGLTPCSCGRLGIQHWPWETSPNVLPGRPGAAT